MGWLRIDRLCETSGRLVRADGSVVLDRCHLADRPIARLVGLLGTADLRDGEGAMFSPCKSVHMFGMRLALSVAFLDADGTLLRIVDRLGPWRTAMSSSAHRVVEARPGAFAGLVVGDRLDFRPA